MPFKSKNQIKACYAKKDKNPNSSWDCDAWMKETTKKVKDLPSKVKKEAAGSCGNPVGKTPLSAIKDKKKLEEGAKIEREHTNNKHTAKCVAADHIKERPDYYSRLKKYVEGDEEIKMKKKGSIKLGFEEWLHDLTGGTSDSEDANQFAYDKDSDAYKLLVANKRLDALKQQHYTPPGGVAEGYTGPNILAKLLGYGDLAAGDSPHRGLDLKDMALKTVGLGSGAWALNEIARRLSARPGHTPNRLQRILNRKII